MADLLTRLRKGCSGPHTHGKLYTVSWSFKAEDLLEAASEIERLRAIENKYAIMRLEQGATDLETTAAAERYARTLGPMVIG